MRVLFSKSAITVGLTVLLLLGAGCIQKLWTKKEADSLRASIAAQTGKSWAVVIGIQNYEKAAEVPFAVADARAVADLLTRQGFHVTALYNEAATRPAIEQMLGETLRNQVGERDRVVLFFAGHTDTRTVAGGNRGFLLPVEGDEGAVVQEAIPVEHLQTLVDALPARQVLVLVDANLGGIEGRLLHNPRQVPGQTVTVLASDRGRHMIVAAEPEQEALQAKEWGHSIFTYYLLDGLGKARADLDRDGLVTASELYGYLDRHVAVAARVLGRVQRPQMWALSDGKGEVLFMPDPQADTAGGPSLPETPATAEVRRAEQELKDLERSAQDLVTRLP